MTTSAEMFDALRAGGEKWRETTRTARRRTFDFIERAPFETRRCE